MGARLFVAMIGRLEERAPCGVFSTVDLAEQAIRNHPSFDPQYDPEVLGVPRAGDTGSRYDIIPFELDERWWLRPGASQR